MKISYAIGGLIEREVFVELKPISRVGDYRGSLVIVGKRHGRKQVTVRCYLCRLGLIIGFRQLKDHRPRL